MQYEKPRLGIIVGSTRDSRFADKPTAWLLKKIAQDGHFDTEVVDIKAFNLPFFNELASNMHIPSEDPAALEWQAKIAQFDAYVFITAEYNHSIPASLKNALDQRYAV